MFPCFPKKLKYMLDIHPSSNVRLDKYLLIIPIVKQISYLPHNTVYIRLPIAEAYGIALM